MTKLFYTSVRPFSMKLENELSKQKCMIFFPLLLADLNKDGKLEWKDFDLARKVEVTHALK